MMADKPLFRVHWRDKSTKEYGSTVYPGDDISEVAQLFSIDHGRRRDMVYVIPERPQSHSNAKGE